MFIWRDTTPLFVTRLLSLCWATQKFKLVAHIVLACRVVRNLRPSVGGVQIKRRDGLAGIRS